MNIYLGNLNYGVKEQDLQTLLEGFGAIDSVKIIVDRESGRSKGFGFAEMSDDEAAKRAIEELSGKEFAGRALVFVFRFTIDSLERNLFRLRFFCKIRIYSFPPVSHSDIGVELEYNIQGQSPLIID